MKVFLALALCFIFYATSGECQKYREPPTLPGGIFKIDPNNGEYKQMVQHGVRILNADVAKKEPLTFVEIKSGTGQVVAGIILELDTVVEVNQERKNCHFTILDQPWEIGRRFDISCDHKNFERFTVKSERYQP